MTPKEAKQFLYENREMAEILALLPQIVEYAEGVRTPRKVVQDQFISKLNNVRNNALVNKITAALEYHGAKAIKSQGKLYYKNIRLSEAVVSPTDSVEV